MAKLTPEQITEKHSRRLKGAVEDMRRGVENVTVAPTQKAAQSIDKMRTKILEAIDSGKVKRGLERVSLQDWQKAMVEKGIPRVAAGIDGARAKMEAFYGELMPHIDRLQAEVNKLPHVSLEDGIQRMVAFSRGMNKFKRTK